MGHFFRLVTIVLTLLRFGVDEVALSGFRRRWVRTLARVATLGRRFDSPRGVRLRVALERLGPIFVKFDRCCRPGATCCRSTSPTNWPDYRTGCRRFPAHRRSR